MYRWTYKYREISKLATSQYYSHQILFLPFKSLWTEISGDDTEFASRSKIIYYKIHEVLLVYSTKCSTQFQMKFHAIQQKYTRTTQMPFSSRSRHELSNFGRHYVRTIREMKIALAIFPSNQPCQIYILKHTPNSI